MIRCTNIKIIFIAGLFYFFTTVPVRAQTDTTGLVKNDTINELPQIVLFGKRDGVFGKIPGSANFIDQKEIKLVAPVSGNEVFRRVTGLNVVDEEGAGLRVNIGIRGLDPARSSGVLMLEDGIPVALNPYGEPAMYYTPSMDRMAGVEVLKGSGQILFGPQTIGGVINYITPDPPAEGKEGTIRIRGGQMGYFSGYAGYGASVGKSGFNVNYLHRRAENLGSTEFQVHDLNAKFKLHISDKSSLGVKVGVYDEESNSTYIGITQSMYNQGGQDFVRIAPHDRLPLRRYALSATHLYKFTPRAKLKTTLFGYTTTRNWQRQDYAYSSFNNAGNLVKPSNYSGVFHGDTTVAGGAILMRNSTGNRNRQFEVLGAESRFSYTYALGSVQNELETGVRVLYERAYEQFIIGAKEDAPSGNMRDNEIRTGKALSAYAQNKFIITDKLSVTAGLRAENYTYERNILRGRFTIDDATVVRDTNVIAQRDIFKLIPGAGINYNLKENVAIFAGVHRGFAPPRIKDAITAVGQPLQLEPELSWNAEIGTRARVIEGLNVELTAFYMNFSNQIVPAALSIGGHGTGVVNAGPTLNKGVETGLNVDFGKLLDMKYAIRYDINATFVDARYNADRFARRTVAGVTDTVNIKGNLLPYAPRVFLSSALGVEAPFGVGVRLVATYVGSQFGDGFNTVEPSANGRIGEIAAYHLLDANAYYKFAKMPASLNLSVKNLTDERYIASRRPEGIRVGLPRMIVAGFEMNF